MWDIPFRRRLPLLQARSPSVLKKSNFSGRRTIYFIEIPDRLGLKQTEMARLLGKTVRTIAGLEGGGSTSEDISRRLTEISRLYEAMIEAGFDKSRIGQWLLTPNPGFSDLKPLEIIERGHSDRIWRMLYGLDEGSLA